MLQLLHHFLKTNDNSRYLKLQIFGAFDEQCGMSPLLITNLPSEWGGGLNNVPSAVVHPWRSLMVVSDYGFKNPAQVYLEYKVIFS